jgi:molybdopterin synthase sulfur carrier subunit
VVVQIRLARAFRRHVDCPDAAVDATTVGAALDAYFTQHPAVRSYVVDEHGAVRKHVAIYCNDEPMLDRLHLSVAVRPGDTIHVLQALSGG